MRRIGRVTPQVLHRPPGSPVAFLISERRALVQEGLEAGGPGEALKRFFVFVGGEANWRALDTDLRERMLQTAGTFVDIERGTSEGYLPTDDELAAITVPTMLLVSDQGRAPQHRAAERLAERLSVPVARTVGTHLAYHDHPEELAAAIRPFLRRVSGLST